MSDPCCLVQLSDPHIAPVGCTVLGGVDTAAALCQAVAAVQRLPLAPCAVLLSGDLTNDARRDSAEHLRTLLAALAVPVLLMPGNHDDRDVLREVFPAAGLPARGPLDQVVTLPGARLVLLDSLVPGEDAGALHPAQLQWLDDTLRAAPAVPTLVAVHHPPFRTGLAGMDTLRLRDGADGLRDVLAAHPQVQRLLCGHVHRAVQCRFGGTLAMTAPSTAHQIDFDLRPGEPPRWRAEPPGMLVHAWDEQAQVVSHVVSTANTAGPFSFG